MADATLLQKVEALLQAAERGFELLEYAEGPVRLRVAFGARSPAGEEAREEVGPPPVRPAPSLPDAATIVSPGVGRLRCSHPAGGRFPGEGEVIAAGTVVALIQAGPLFQPVSADRAGRLGRRLVEDGAGVGFGTALFEFSQHTGS